MARTLVMLIEVDENKTAESGPLELMAEFLSILDGKVQAPGVFTGPPQWVTFGDPMERVGRRLLQCAEEEAPVEVPQGKGETGSDHSSPAPLPEFSLPPGPVFLKDLW